MTIENKSAKNANEALAILKSYEPHNHVEYLYLEDTCDGNITYRHFASTTTHYHFIEVVINEKLDSVMLIDTAHDNSGIKIILDKSTDSKEDSKMTIETKITNNGRLVLNVDGKRQSYDDVMMRLRYARNNVINIITDRGQSYTGSYNQDRYIFEDDSTGNWLQFDSKEEAVNRLSSGNFREENFIRKFADQDDINKKLQAEIETLDEQRHDHEIEIWHIGNIIKTLQQSRKYCQELTFGFDRDFYNTRFEALDDNIKILTERKSALLEQCDKLFEQINQLQAQMVVIDF